MVCCSLWSLLLVCGNAMFSIAEHKLQLDQNSKALIVEPGQVEKVIGGDRNRRVVAATSTNQVGLEQLVCIGCYMQTSVQHS